MTLESITLNNKEKVGMISNLSTMLSAGIPLLDTVESILEGSKGNQQKILEILRDDLTQGKHIYSSFSKFPRVFDKVTVNIIKASEEAGTLEITLKELRVSIQKEIELADKIKGALAYPLLILVVFTAVLLLILGFVIPKISAVFFRLQISLPLPTKVLIALSNFLLSYTVFIFTFSIVIGVLSFWAYKKRKKEFMRIILSLPFVSTFTKKVDLQRFSHSLSLLLHSGIPITGALDLTEDVVVRGDIARAIAYAKESIIAGRKLSEAFREKKNIFPTMVVKITEAGEKTGSLDKAMQDIGEYLDYEISNTLRTMTVMLEPVMLVVIGTLIGLMMLAIISPIYGLISQVGSR